MNCTRCKSANKVKRGFVRNKQRYNCKDCDYNYTVKKKSTSKSDQVKRQALQLYLEGLGFRSIGRYLNVSHVSVYQWIKSYGSKLEKLKSNQSIEVVEVDEMHSYIGDKKTTVGYGLLLIDLEKGSSTSLLAIEARKRQRGFGKKSSTMK